jgi:hypothetical protein
VNDDADVILGSGGGTDPAMPALRSRRKRPHCAASS